MIHRENFKHESQIKLPTASHSRMFGVPLEELMGVDGEKDGLPRVVKDCIQYLRQSGASISEQIIISFAASKYASRHGRGGFVPAFTEISGAESSP